MNIYIGENIKRLRKEKDMTQETLADFLGVSFQSVSKWERGEALPDITLVPSIANYFGVTIDELMGNDKIINEEKIQKYLAEYDELNLLDTPESCRQKNTLAKEVYRNYPYDWRVIDMYRHSLVCGYDAETFEENKSVLRRLCEMILDRCNVEEYRAAAIHALLYICEDDGEAEKLLGQFPHDIVFWQSFVRANHYIGRGRYDEARLQQQKNLHEYYGYVTYAMVAICSSYPNMPSPEPSYVIAMTKKQIAIANILFENGEKSDYLGSCNTLIAQEYLKLGDIENGLEYLDEAVKSYIKYDAQPAEFQYTSLGFERIMHKDSEKLNEWYSIELLLHGLENDECYDCVRNDERFKRSVELLKQHKPVKKYFRLEK